MGKYGVMMGLVLMVLFASCSTKHAIEVAPVKVEPVHITIDVNIRVDRALDNFFEDIDEAGNKTATPSQNGK